jgi:N-methylhydantoinase A/oxoprolinase/acetone carboxylase beta subunit
MLLADATKDYSLTLLQPTADVTEEDLRTRFAPLIDRGMADLAHEGFSREDIRVECALDIRYRGQAYEITIPFTPSFEEQFHILHRKLYGYASPTRTTEIVHLRVKAIGRTDKPPLPRFEQSPKPLPNPTSVRPARFKGRNLQTPVYRRDSLSPGMSGQGPAIIAGAQSTTAVPPGFQFTIDAVGTLVATHAKSSTTKSHAATEPHAH